MYISILSSIIFAFHKKRCKKRFMYENYSDHNNNEEQLFSDRLLEALHLYLDQHYVPEDAAVQKPVINNSSFRKETQADKLEIRPQKDSLIRKKGSGKKKAGEDAQQIRMENGIPVLSETTPRIPKNRAELNQAVKHVGETFQQKLFRLIDDRGFSDVEVYRRANIDRRLFSKIRHNEDYHPGKKTVLALAVALCLNLSETKDLLRRAGMAFSPASRMDLIVEFCIQNRIYDLFKVNALLEEYGEEVL